MTRYGVAALAAALALCGCGVTESAKIDYKSEKKLPPLEVPPDLTTPPRDERYQIPGAEHLRLGYKNDGYVARWRGIYDDKRRIMIAISFNSDVGDSWEWADDPRYPEKFSDLGIRIGVNDVVYAMTH